MKYETIDARRMNEYLGYMKTCLIVYKNGNNITEQEYNTFSTMIDSLQGLNSKMEDIE